MKLHRTSGQPDWEKVNPRDYTFFQKLAAATSGIVSPANFITIVGLVFVSCGLYALLTGQLLDGLALLVLGRALDIADGTVAELTHTKSPVGELFDASADKLATAATIIVIGISGIVSWWLLLALVLPQIMILLIIIYKKSRGISLHPTRHGKLSMALLWLALAGTILLKLASGSLFLAITVYALGLASFLLGLYAAWQYLSGRD